MKVLMIGGTGTISMAITRLLCQSGWEVYLFNRGSRREEMPGAVHWIQADMNNEDDVQQAIRGLTFDCVCQFIGFQPEQVARDIRLFAGRTKQYLFTSSASAYHKPVMGYRITEGTALANPYWQYSRDKIACEEVLMKAYRESGFPVTIIRPSHTYDNRKIPLGVHGKNGSFQVLKRMMEGKPVIIHGDGTSLWTMTHNTDFARGYVGLMGNPHAIGEAFQITNDETLTWNQIYGTIADCLGVELKPYYVSSHFLAATQKYDLLGSLVGDKANSVVFDNRKLKAAVPDFRPQVRFEQGIRDTIANVLAHPELQQEDPEFDQWCDRVIEAQEQALKQIFQEGRTEEC